MSKKLRLYLALIIGFVSTTNFSCNPPSEAKLFIDFASENEVDVLMIGGPQLEVGINEKYLSVNLKGHAKFLKSGENEFGEYYRILKNALEISNPKIVIIDASGGIKWPAEMLPPKREKNKKVVTPGRFVIDVPCLNQTTIDNYSDLNGLDFSSLEIDNPAERKLDKIKELCAENGIKLIALTLPMHSQHARNFEDFERNLKPIFEQAGVEWLNLQNQSEDFFPHCFENKNEGIQLLTYRGGLLATNKLSEEILKMEDVSLVNREEEVKWVTTYYGEEGFFETRTPMKGDLENVVVFDGKPETPVKEIIQLKRKEGNQVIIKIFPKDSNIVNGIRGRVAKVDVYFLDENNERIWFNLKVPYDYERTKGDQLLYVVNLKKYDLIKTGDVTF